MTLRQTKFNTKAQDYQVLGRKAIGSLRKEGHFQGYDFTPQPGKLYFTTRAISARVNRNYDGFPSQELKTAHQTFVGRPYFVNHANTDHTRTRGIILGSKFKENGNDRYIELLCGIDANAFPKLANEISRGNLDGVSMGVDVEKTICSYCYRIARAPEEFCDHVLYMKGQTLPRIGKFGQKEYVLVFESCYGLNFFELSSVFDPADETALVQEVLLPRMAKTGTRFFESGERAEEIREKWPNMPGLDKMGFGEATAPPQVNTLREDSLCPQCGDEDFDGTTCQWCNYNAPPQELQDPDLDMAKKIDRNQEGMGNAEPEAPGGGLAEAISDTIENLEGLFELEQVVQQFAQGLSPSDISSPLTEAPLATDDNIDESSPDVSGEGFPPEEVPDSNDENEDGAIPIGGDPVAEDQVGESPLDQGTPLEGEEPSTEEIAVDQPPGQEIAPEDQAIPSEEEIPEGNGVPSEADTSSIEQQVQDLVEGVDQLVQEITGQSDTGTGEEENPEMPVTSRPRTPALSSTSAASRLAQAQRRLQETQQRLADLSKNVGLADGEEAIADTPPAEAGTSSTDAERNGEDSRTNVQDLDSNPATKEQEMQPDERQPVEMPTRSVAKLKLGSKEIENIFDSCDGRYATLDLGSALAKASYDYAQKNNFSAQTVLAQVLAAANRRKSSLNEEDLKSLASMSELFIRRVKSENNDPYDMMSNKDNLQLAKPTDRVDVEAPVGNDTNDYAQASQYDPAKYDKNRGADIAKPDDVNTMNWWPGEKPTVHSTYNPAQANIAYTSAPHIATVQKASAIDAVKLAETYIDLGVFSSDLKYDKIAEFEDMPKSAIQQQQFALDAVRRAIAHNGQKPRGVVPRAAAGHRPVPQMGRAASYDPSPVDDVTWLAL